MVGRKQKRVLSSYARNVANGEKGFRKALGNQVSLVAGELPEDVFADRQETVFNGVVHTPENEMFMAQAPSPGDGRVLSLGHH